MSLTDPVSFPASRKSNRNSFIYDSFLALGETCLLTGFIFLFHLSAILPDCLLIYLLVILTLAYTRGLYPALLASIIAFLSFDFLFVAPIYSLRVTKFQDILALLAFLVSSVITAQLAAAMRLQALKNQDQMHKLQVLYTLVCAANKEEDLEGQLRLFLQALVELVSPFGVYNAMVLLCNSDGSLGRHICLHPSEQPVKLSADDEYYGKYALTHNCAIDLTGVVGNPQATIYSQAHYVRFDIQKECYVRVIPLKAGQKSIGLLRLDIASSLLHEKKGVFCSNARDLSSVPVNVYFSMLLEEAIAVIERDGLRRERVQVQVLQQAEELRVALLSSVSHHLRSPLATIKATATGMRQEEADIDKEGQGSAISSIVREVDRLDGLIENLLDMSRIEAGALHPEKRWCALDELVYDVLNRMRPLFQKRVVTTHVQDGLSPLELDYVQIDQVFTNLIENALYYTPAGSPLEIDIREKVEWVQVSVTDYGPGVPMTERERIFDKFYRVPATTEKSDHRGTGLGLAICRGLIEAHAGQVWVEAGAEGGARFCFTLPRRSTEGENDEEASAYLNH